MTKLKGVVSHHDREVSELRADRDLAVEYLRAAMSELDNPEDRGAALLALRTVAEALWRAGRGGGGGRFRSRRGSGRRLEGEEN